VVGAEEAPTNHPRACSRLIFNDPDLVINAGTMKSVASGGLVIAIDVLKNSKTIEALGSGATVRIQSGTFGSNSFFTFISNSGAGMIFASGSGAQIDLGDVFINKGMLKAVGSNAMIVMSAGVSIFGATIAGGSLVEVVSNSSDQFSGTLGPGVLVDVTGSNTIFNLTGNVVNSGAIVARDSGSKIFIATGAVVSGGTVVAQGSGSEVEITNGAVVKGGTLSAQNAGSEILLLGGALVSGGAVKIGNGVVEVAFSGSENVAFAANGSGGLILDGFGNAYKGRVSGFGFGASAHSDPSEFIVFNAFGSSATIRYVSANAANTSGTLIVSSGGATVSVTLIGNYTSGNFIPLTSGGHFAVTDPGALAAASPQSANLALFGNYIAAGFPSPLADQTGALISAAAPTLLLALTHPHA